MDNTNLLDDLLTCAPAMEISNQDEHWHFITCGVIIGSGGC